VERRTPTVIITFRVMTFANPACQFPGERCKVITWSVMTTFEARIVEMRIPQIKRVVKTQIPGRFRPEVRIAICNLQFALCNSQ
jgi:hypothetical protein